MPEKPKLFDDLVSNVKQAFREDHAILSFPEYFTMVLEDPKRHLRSAPQYLVDMFEHFGREELDLAAGKVTRFKLFDAPFADGEGRVAGQEAVQEAIYRLIANFAREGRVNKLILLHGPNGSAKSLMVACIMAGMEAYARCAAGAVYSFNWIFPSERMSSERIGFGSTRQEAARDSHAYLPAESIDARVPCDMHDHPLFLIPRPERDRLLAELLPRAAGASETADEPHTAASDYLRRGDLCYKCRRIYDALLASCDGDLSKVLNHIQIERFYLSRRYRRGAATIEAQLSVDARAQQVTADKSLSALPRALQHVSLFDPAGPLVDANRGLLEFSDLLKRPVDTFKYLLSTVETATVSMDSFVLHLDMAFIASTNETYLDAFKEHPDFPSFKGRMELIKVPYLVRYTDEKGIYEPQITHRVVGRHVAPHAIDVAALWAVLTRMRKCDYKLYADEISKVIDSLTPIEKLQLYDTGEVPDRVTTREAKELRHLIPDLYEESVSYPNYEGRFGASAREIRTALLNAAHHESYDCLSPLAVFEQMREILAAKGVYEFLKQDVVSGYHDHKHFLEQAEEIFTDWVDDEIRESMGLAGEKSYVELFSKYVNHVSHWVKGEKMRDVTSGQFLDADEKLMAEIEKVLMAEGEKAEDFRKSVIGSIGAQALDNPDSPPDYELLFKSYIQQLREDFYDKRKEVLKKINQNFLKYASDEQESLEAKEKEQVRSMLGTLEVRYGYCESCARDTVAYLLKKRYAD